MKKGGGEKHEQLLCGELDPSSSHRTEFVNRAAESDELLLKDVQTPSDKTEWEQQSSSWLISSRHKWKCKRISWVLLHCGLNCNRILCNFYHLFFFNLSLFSFLSELFQKICTSSLSNIDVRSSRVYLVQIHAWTSNNVVQKTYLFPDWWTCITPPTAE